MLCTCVAYHRLSRLRTRLLFISNYAWVRMRKWGIWYSSRFCECVCVCVCACVCVCMCVCVSVLLVSAKLLKTKRWYVERKCNSTISQFLIGQNVKKMAVFLWCVWFVHLGGSLGSDPDSCKGYPLYSRLISTLLYHECDGDTQEILIALLSKLSLLWHACYYIKCILTCPVLVVLHHLFTHLNHNLIGVYSACLLVCSYRNVHSCIVTSLFQQLL